MGAVHNLRQASLQEGAAWDKSPIGTQHVEAGSEMAILIWPSCLIFESMYSVTNIGRTHQVTIPGACGAKCDVFVKLT